jgi:AcrR family transcriptional regulator
VPRVLSPEDVEDFRRRLCAAAQTLFAERGIEAVTMRELAQALGVSPMTPYRYFKDKDAILAAVRAMAFDRFAASLEAAMAKTTDPVDRSRQAGQAYIAFALAEPQAYRLMFDLTQPTEDDYPELHAAIVRARRTMTDHVEALIDAGLLEGDAELIGHMFWSALHGLLMLRLSGKLAASVDPAKLQALTLLTLIRGLGVAAG